MFAEVCLHQYEDFAQAAIEMIGRYRAHHPDAVAVALAFFDMMTGDEDLFRLLQRDLIMGNDDLPHFRSQPQFRQLIGIIGDLPGFRSGDGKSDVKTLSRRRPDQRLLRTCRGKARRC